MFRALFVGSCRRDQSELNTMGWYGTHLNNSYPQGQCHNSSDGVTETKSTPDELLPICMESPEVKVYTNAEKQDDEDATEHDVGVVRYAACYHNVWYNDTRRGGCHERAV
jgi:hypothetical protein